MCIRTFLVLSSLAMTALAVETIAQPQTLTTAERTAIAAETCVEELRAIRALLEAEIQAQQAIRARQEAAEQDAVRRQKQMLEDWPKPQTPRTPRELPKAN
jgi:hypothetical protein